MSWFSFGMQYAFSKKTKKLQTNLVRSMENLQTLDLADADKRSWAFDRIFGEARKDTVIRLRWPLVILSTYLLYYTPSEWLSPVKFKLS